MKIHLQGDNLGFLKSIEALLNKVADELGVTFSVVNAGDWSILIAQDANWIQQNLTQTSGRVVACVPESQLRSVAGKSAYACISPAEWTSEGVADRVLGHVALALDPSRCHMGKLLAVSPIMRKLIQTLQKLARLEEPVLFLGETGVGKTLVAEVLHDLSGRAGGYFSCNVSEFSRELLESELFGHVRGAFTGATTDRKGLMVVNRGTLFLDEFGELDLGLQSKMLHCIEEKRVRPVGANSYQTVAARLIFATNRDLKSMAELGKFREDLYQRLSYFEVVIPPLRERRVDIPILANYFLSQFNRENKTKYGITHQTHDELFRYHWPGNVRELKRVIYRAAGLSSDPEWIDLAIVQDATAPMRALKGTNGSLFTYEPLKEQWHQVRDRLQIDYFTILRAKLRKMDEIIRASGLSRAQCFKILKEKKQ